LADHASLFIETPPLAGCRILVVEDEYLIADDLAALLREEGAEVLGPATSLPTAMRLAGDSDRIDGAILNIDLRGVAVFPLADELQSRGVPFIFLTGYAESNIPGEYAGILRCEKPVAAAHVVGHLKPLLRSVSA
jgi:DNA-binding response OmpR family regulator